jgi:hypothetical protein
MKNWGKIVFVKTSQIATSSTLISLINAKFRFVNNRSCGKLGRGASSTSSECKASPKAVWEPGMLCCVSALKKN